MQFLHGYQLGAVTKPKSTNRGTVEYKGMKTTVKSSSSDTAENKTSRAGINPEVLIAADKFSKAVKEAKNGEEAGKAFDALVASQNISEETMNEKTSVVSQGILDPENTECKKVGFVLATLIIAVGKTPELSTKDKTDPKEEAAKFKDKPLKEYFALIRSKIVKAKGGSEVGWSTTKKILVFGGGALALGGVVYFATRKPKKS